MSLPLCVIKNVIFWLSKTQNNNDDNENGNDDSRESDNDNNNNADNNDYNSTDNDDYNGTDHSNNNADNNDYNGTDNVVNNGTDNDDNNDSSSNNRNPVIRNSKSFKNTFFSFFVAAAAALFVVATPSQAIVKEVRVIALPVFLCLRNKQVLFFAAGDANNNFNSIRLWTKSYKTSKKLGRFWITRLWEKPLQTCSNVSGLGKQWPLKWVFWSPKSTSDISGGKFWESGLSQSWTSRKVTL